MTRHDESSVVRKSVRVQTAIEQAFSVFVEQMETWWPAEHHIGAKPFASIFVEPRAGGRWYERAGDGEVCEWGRVLVWEPPHRVTFSWHLGVDWKFDPSLERASEVALRFTAEGPRTTLVELEHSKIERHGDGYEQLRELMDGPDAWARTLQEYAAAANAEVSA